MFRRAFPLVLLLLLLPLAACSDADPDRKPPEAAPTPIDRLNTSQMVIPRVKYCDLVSKTAVAEALGGKSKSSNAWANGEEAPVDGARKDVTHEFGCQYRAGTATAETWVFARPVEARFARTILRTTGHRSDCTSRPGPGFGQPSQLQTCRQPGGVVRVRYAGLFDQTWLTCQVSDSAPANEVRQRADKWCVRIVNATNTTR